MNPDDPRIAAETAAVEAVIVEWEANCIEYKGVNSPYFVPMPEPVKRALAALIARVYALGSDDALADSECEMMKYEEGKGYTDCETMRKAESETPWWCRTCSARMRKEIEAQAALAATRKVEHE